MYQRRVFKQLKALVARCEPLAVWSKALPILFSCTMNNNPSFLWRGFESSTWNQGRPIYFIRLKLWKGIRVTMLFDLLTCFMQCCFIQCMIFHCLIFLLQFQFDFITFHFFFLQSCFRAYDICPSSMQDFHCAMRYAILRSTIIHTPSCHYSYFVKPSLLRLCLLQLFIQMALHSYTVAKRYFGTINVTAGTISFLTAGTISSYGSLTWRTKNGKGRR